ncbi:MAG TPA: Ig-like domain-containing protein [Candidatus Limnocylindrales bacterium]
MRRRLISLGSLLVAVIALGLVLYNATLVDRRAPGITRISLSATANGDAGRAQTLTAIDIEFSEPVRTGSVESRFRIVPYVAGTLSWDGNIAIFTPSAKLPPDTAFAVYVDPGFEDLEGNAATTGLDAWAFRTVGPPVVVKADPADGADGVGVEGSLTVTFDRLMDTRSVESAIRVEPTAAIRPAWSGPVLTLAFDGPLQFGTTYDVTIETTAADTDGSRLLAPFTTRFTTVAAGLRVRTTTPANGVSGVSVRAPIAIVFDGTIDPASVTDAIRITPAVSGDTRIVALPADATPRPEPSGSTTSGGEVLLFQPSGPLAAHTTYTVTLASVVARPGAPSQVAAGRTWTFTTGQPTVSGQNQIAFLSARGGVRDVWLMNPDGSNPRQLTTGLVPVAGFDFNADGSRVAWSAGGTIQTMRIDGTDQRQTTGAGRFEYAPRFSPDGRSLLVGRRGGDGTDLGYWVVPVADGAPAERQVLQFGAPPLGSSLLPGDGISAGEGTPAWAPRAAFDATGRHVLVTTGSGAVELVDLKPADPDLAVVDTGIVASAGPAWSPSGTQFVVVGRRAGETSDSVYVVGIDGGVTRGAAATGSVAASSDGVAAFLVRDVNGATHVAVGRPNAATVGRSLTTASDVSDRWPAFSPDGRSILFGRVRGDAPDVSAGIWVVDPATGKLLPLAADGAYPRWLP